MGGLPVQSQRLTGSVGGRPFAARIDETAITLAIGAPEFTEVVAWDLGGRLYSVWRSGHTWRRGLGGTALHKWLDGDRRGRERIGGAALDRLVDESARLAAWVLASGGTGDAVVSAALRRAADFDAPAARADAARFASIYSDVGMLPPDQYLSTVVELTEGCTHDRCTFCDLYQRPFRVRSAPEFDDHLRAVRGYLGASRPLRARSIFLGAANALAVSPARLAAALEAVADAFEGATPVSGFLDAHRGSQHSERDYRDLRARGLDRVY